MELSENPDYLRRLREAVAEFRDSFGALMRLCIYTGMAPGLAPYVVPNTSVSEGEFRVAATRVAVAAGRAAKAPSLTGALYKVEGRGLVDPIANWRSVMEPKPIFSPDTIIATVDAVLGRLDAMIDEAETFALPPTGVANMHPLIWEAARPLWHGGHYRQAVATAAEALVADVKARVERRNISETSLWQQVFSADPPREGQPRLRWPGDEDDRDVKTMTDGLRQFAPGVQMTIRNPAAHGGDQPDPQVAFELLSTLSLLARWTEHCELRTAPPSSPTEATC